MVRGKWQSGHCCRTVTAIVGVLLTILMLVPATAQTKNIFWTDRVARKIQRANLDGTGITDLTTGIMHQYILAVDAANNKVYWTESANFKIGRANLDGTGDLPPYNVPSPKVRIWDVERGPYGQETVHR